MRNLGNLSVGLLALGVIATACGDDDDDDRVSTSTGGSAGSGGSFVNSGGSAQGGSGGSAQGGAGGSSQGSVGGSAQGGSGGTMGGAAGESGGGGEASVHFEVLIENLEPDLPIRQSGAFSTPETASDPGPIGPGGSYEVRFAAAPGDRLSFATMFVQSNDLFVAPAPTGIALFDQDDMPISGDITSELDVWDAGTETNQLLGEGEDQAPRQSAPDTGEADTDDTVRLVQALEYDNLPALSDMFSATLSAEADGVHFTLTLTNESAPGDLDTTSSSVDILFSPGAFAVHTSEATLFDAGTAASPGLEAIAEDGAPGAMVDALLPHTGLLSPLAPGVWAVHASGGLFEEDEADPGLGLEALAEDGDPAPLADAVADFDSVVSSGVFSVPDGADDPGPALPGESYSFEFDAMPGDRLSFATMYVQSNDLFFAPRDTGLSLFSNGTARSGEITDELHLWDAGTEVNQPPGLGDDQAPRQSGVNTGEAEDGTVHEVNDGYSYGSPTTLLRVTLDAD